MQRAALYLYNYLFRYEIKDIKDQKNNFIDHLASLINQKTNKILYVNPRSYLKVDKEFQNFLIDEFSMEDIDDFIRNGLIDIVKMLGLKLKEKEKFDNLAYRASKNYDNAEYFVHGLVWNYEKAHVIVYDKNYFFSIEIDKDGYINTNKKEFIYNQPLSECLSSLEKLECKQCKNQAFYIEKNNNIAFCDSKCQKIFYGVGY